MDLRDLSAGELAAQIRAQRASPVEVVEHYLDRIADQDPRLGAFLTVDADAALLAARSAEREAARGRTGPLHGLPVAVKDLIPTAGLRTTAGSRVLADWVPRRDAAVVGALRRAGAIVLGKTHCTEFGVWGTGGHPDYPPPRNPWSPDRMPGGSSTGSAVAVAARLAPIALGTDTGGSSRIPAAFCGLVGLKPTRGRIATSGLIPLSWSHDHVGVLGRSVADVRLVFRALRASRRRHATDRDSVDLGRIRLGALDLGVEPQAIAAAAVDRALEAIRRCGAATAPVAVPSAHLAAGVSRAVQYPELLSYHRARLQTRARDYGEDALAGLRIGADVTAADYVEAQRAAQMLTAELDAALRRVDAVVTPTVGFAAPPVGATRVELPGGGEDVNAAISEYTRLCNITGHPAVSLPCGVSPDGLPLGLQLIGRRGQDEALLAIAETVERAADLRLGPPPADRWVGPAAAAC